MPKNALFSAHPAPPMQPAVGNAPITFLRKLPRGQFVPEQLAAYNINGPLTRTQVREICTNPAVNPLAAYAVAMAWGGQKDINFESSIKAPVLPDLLQNLRNSQQERGADFQKTQKVVAQIEGVGIAFFTKLLYFFRSQPDAYILDQWTAKSACILFEHPPVRLGQRGNDKGYYPPADDTTAVEYGAFCSAIECLATELWPGVIGAGQFAEAAMFDVGKGKGVWRSFVKDHFLWSAVGNKIRDGARCLTTSQDYDHRWFILRQGKQTLVFACAGHHSSSMFSILLARLRDLKASSIHFLPVAGSSVVLDDSFVDACSILGVAISDKRDLVARDAQVKDVSGISHSTMITQQTHQPDQKHPHREALHLTWTEKGSFIRLHWPDNPNNQGYISRNEKYLSLTNRFVDKYLALKQAFEAHKTYSKKLPHSGSNYFGTVTFGSKAKAIAFLEEHGFGVQDNTG